MAGPQIPTVRISSAGELVAVTPLLLGFVPDNSLVVVCVDQTHNRLGTIMRYDLPRGRRDANSIAEEVADRVELAEADGVFVLIFSDLAPVGAWLPHRDVVNAVERWLPADLLDSLLVQDDRWWPYDLRELSGQLVDGASRAATAVSAVRALSGRGVLPDRAAVVASLGVALSADERLAMVERIERRLRRCARQSQSARRAAVRVIVDRLVIDLADPRHTATDDQVASFVALVQDVVVRDEVLVRGVEPAHRDALRPVLHQILRRTPDPYDAPVASSLAWIAYACGDGITANVALGRALTSESDYPLARLIADTLHRQVPPALLERVMREAGDDMSGVRRRDASA